MPQTTTLGRPGKAVTFNYTGSVLDGVRIQYDYGDVAVTAGFFKSILRAFDGKKVPGGFSEDNPTPGGLGEWVRDNCRQNAQSLTPRHASRIAAILVAEGYAKSYREANAVSIEFYKRQVVAAPGMSEQYSAPIGQRVSDEGCKNRLNVAEYIRRDRSPRWFGYFDLLGTSALIRSGRTEEVFMAYQDAINQFCQSRNKQTNVFHAWFSDTFILYSEDGSAAAFGAIEQICRFFMFHLLIRKIPFRGALSFGEFYADRKYGLYLGEALLEAYEHGENQDWIGFILCPSSVKRLEDLSLPVNERANYTEYPVPFKKDLRNQARFGACLLGWWYRNADGGNLLLPALREMALQVDPRIRGKYERTIHFLTEFAPRVADKSQLPLA